MEDEIRVDEAAGVDGIKQPEIGKASKASDNVQSNEGKTAEGNDNARPRDGESTETATTVAAAADITAATNATISTTAANTTTATDATTAAAATDATIAATTADAEGENHGGAVEGAAAELVESGGGDSDEPGNGPDIETLVAEAERRGYIRGRNERIEELMAEPGVWEQPESQPEILSRRRRSIWD